MKPGHCPTPKHHPPPPFNLPSYTGHRAEERRRTRGSLMERDQFQSSSHPLYLYIYRGWCVGNSRQTVYKCCVGFICTLYSSRHGAGKKRSVTFNRWFVLLFSCKCWATEMQQKDIVEQKTTGIACLTNVKLCFMIAARIDNGLEVKLFRISKWSCVMISPFIPWFFSF